ncbi:MAG: hypothetical protein ACRC8Z_00510 [Empedobacter falsenii]
MDNTQNTNTQEIDLVYLGRQIKTFLKSISFTLYRLIKFIIEKKYILLILFAIGISLGFLYNKYSRVIYKTELIIIPNFNSNDYLYSEIENFKSNIPRNKKEKLFMDNLINIEITPVMDINTYIDDSNNREFLKVLSENGEKFEQIIKNKDILKTNKLHLIIITTKSKEYTSQIVQFLMDNLNNSKYFLERQTFEIKNLKEKKIQLNKSIEQINQILDHLGKEGIGGTGKELNIYTYDQLNSVIDLKKIYLEEISKIEVKLIESEKIVYPINISYNNESEIKIYKNMIILIPVGLILIFFVFSYFNYLYRKLTVTFRDEYLKEK